MLLAPGVQEPIAEDVGVRVLQAQEALGAFEDRLVDEPGEVALGRVLGNDVAGRLPLAPKRDQTLAPFAAEQVGAVGEEELPPVQAAVPIDVAGVGRVLVAG